MDIGWYLEWPRPLLFMGAAAMGAVAGYILIIIELEGLLPF